MHKVYILCIACGIMFCATSTLAQLSANPWVDANTKEQIDEVYKKYQRRGYKDNSLEYVEESEIVIENSKKHIEELEEQEEPSFIEKLSSSFGGEDEIEEKERVVEKQTNKLTAKPQSNTRSSSFGLGSTVNKVKNSLRLPSLNTNNMIKSFEQSIGVDFKGMAKKFK